MSKFFNARTALAGCAAAAALSAGAQADQVILDDLIVDGSTCVGQDCVNGENFGFDTLRLKENNLRIDFTDTSNSASFPTNDWSIVANDATNGGGEYLAFQDDGTGRQIFRVDAGAPANSLRVTSAGRIGIGTATPSVNVHVATGNTPTLRLEQNGSSGFTAQTWDIAGNEANFFIRDATNGSRLPFKIQPGAPNNALYVASDGDIGMGTQSPQDDLHIVDSGSAAIRLEATGASADNPVRINLNGNNDELRITWDGLVPATNQLRLDETGKLTIAGGMATGSSCIQMDTLACTFAVGTGQTSCVVGGC